MGWGQLWFLWPRRQKGTARLRVRSEGGKQPVSPCRGSSAAKKHGVHTHTGTPHRPTHRHSSKCASPRVSSCVGCRSFCCSEKRPGFAASAAVCTSAVEDPSRADMNQCFSLRLWQLPWACSWGSILGNGMRQPEVPPVSRLPFHPHPCELAGKRPLRTVPVVLSLLGTSG